MEEENVINEEALPEDGEEEKEAPAAESAEQEAQESAPTPEETGGAEEPLQSEAGEISAEDFAKTLQNPMFAAFARGRRGDISDIVRDFAAMLDAGKGLLSEEARMKLTPGAGYCGGAGVALSERQRKIAREAGMSYREYYELIRALPEKANR